MSEPAKSQPDLQGIYPRIEVGEGGVRDVHEPKLGAKVVFATQKVQAQGAAGREVYPRSTGGHIVIREECAASEFEVGNDFAGLRKIPFKREGIQPEAIRGAEFLDHNEDGHYIHRVFELTAQKSWANWRG